MTSERIYEDHPYGRLFKAWGGVVKARKSRNTTRIGIAQKALEAERHRLLKR